MSVSLNIVMDIPEAVRQLRSAAEAKKCWGCGCLHNSLDAITKALPMEQQPAELREAIGLARQRLTPTKYDCLGCEVCYPPLAMNALNIEGEACPAETVTEREGWPPLPGSYTVLRYQAPVAICTLSDDALAQKLASLADPNMSIVGTCQTENLGIERIIQNVLVNPNIRFLIVAGADSRQAIGHLPGQSLMALGQNGIDERGRIIGAKGKRPVLRNVSAEAVGHFRQNIELVDCIGTDSPSQVLARITECASRNPGPAQPSSPRWTVQKVQGYIPPKMISDPNGYFVVYVDQEHKLLLVEHYANTGVLTTVIEGKTAAEAYIPCIERGLVSRLDHAAYLGRELARAEQALGSGSKYIQDAAPERPLVDSVHLRPVHNASCGCGTGCGGEEEL
jgi:tetrahydromethanopterin S-methyltransferase subunit A